MTPLPLRVRTADDLTQQRHYHRVTALARALHGSHTVIPLTAAQPAPNARRRVNAAGGTEYAQLMSARTELETRYWRLMRARRAGTVTDIVQADRDIDRLESRMRALARQLAEIDTRKAAPAGLPYLYSVRVGALEVSGHLPATFAPECWTLDTRTLPDDLRERLTAYLLSGRDAVPYSYRRERGRYRVNPNATPDALALMGALWRHVEQGTGKGID